MLRTAPLIHAVNCSALPTQMLRGGACRRQCMESTKRPGYPASGQLERASAGEELVVASFEVVTLLHKPRPKRSPVGRRIRYLVDDEHAAQTRS